MVQGAVAIWRNIGTVPGVVTSWSLRARKM